MTEFNINGATCKVWSMSLMGWRWFVHCPDGTEKAGTKKTERAAILAARKYARS